MFWKHSSLCVSCMDVEENKIFQLEEFNVNPLNKRKSLTLICMHLSQYCFCFRSKYLFIYPAFRVDLRKDFVNLSSLTRRWIKINDQNIKSQGRKSCAAHMFDYVSKQMSVDCEISKRATLDIQLNGNSWKRF